MITVSWGTFTTLVLLVVAVGPGFYLMGRVCKQVDHNTHDIETIYRKLDDIWHFVKNGKPE